MLQNSIEMRVSKSPCLNACAVFGLILLLGVTQRPITRYLRREQRSDILNVTIRTQEITPWSPTFKDSFADNSPRDSIQSSKSKNPTKSKPAQKIAITSQLSGGSFDRLGGKIQSNEDPIVMRDLIPDEPEMNRRVPTRFRPKRPKSKSKSNKIVHKKRDRKKAQREFVHTTRAIHYPNVVTTKARNGKRRLYYEHKTKKELKVTRYIAPKICKCRQIHAEQSPCYEYTNKATKKCRLRECSSVFECFEGGSRLCKKIRQTSTVIHDENDTCKTIRVEADLYVPQ